MSHRNHGRGGKRNPGGRKETTVAEKKETTVEEEFIANGCAMNYEVIVFLQSRRDALKAEREAMKAQEKETEAVVEPPTHEKETTPAQESESVDAQETDTDKSSSKEELDAIDEVTPMNEKEMPATEEKVSSEEMDTCSSTDAETQTSQESSSQEYSDTDWRTVKKRKRRAKILSSSDEGRNPTREKVRKIAQEKEVIKKNGSRSPVQCFRCQGYQHTQWTCEKNPKCLKCGQDHLTYTCKKERSTSCKCANCGLDHPANYRGCPEFKKIQKSENRKITAKESKNITPDL